MNFFLFIRKKQFQNFEIDPKTGKDQRSHLNTKIDWHHAIASYLMNEWHRMNFVTRGIVVSLREEAYFP